MSNFTYYVVLDIETKRSASDCLYCGQEEAMHEQISGGLLCPRAFLGDGETFTPIGWTNKAALGLSIGCAWDSRNSRTYFFDEMNLADTMQRWVDEQPLIVTFNGMSFDLPLLRGVLRRRTQTLPPEDGAVLTALCDAFKLLCATSYDVLAAVWQCSPESKRVKGLNRLGSIAESNGYGGKTGDGAETPRLWAAGQYAEVINYCAWDVELTRRLFEQIQRGEPIRRHDGTTLLLPKAKG